jgi:hypothetical protein
MFKMTILYKSIIYKLFCTVGLSFSSYYKEKIDIRELLCIKSDSGSIDSAG